MSPAHPSFLHQAPELPKFYRVKMTYPQTRITDIEKAVNHSPDPALPACGIRPYTHEAAFRGYAAVLHDVIEDTTLSIGDMPCSQTVNDIHPRVLILVFVCYRIQIFVVHV